MNYTAEQLEAAVATARAEGESRIADAVAAERERFASVLRVPEAKGREAQAIAVALIGVTAAQASAILAASPLDQTPARFSGQRASEAPGGLVIEPAAHGHAGAALTDNHGWTGVIAELNKANAAETGSAR